MRGHSRIFGVWIGLFVLALAMAGSGRAAAVDFEKAIPEQYRVGGYALGCQAYSFRAFSFFEAVDKTRQTGCRLIEAFPGQKLSPEDDVKFDHNAPPDALEKARKKLDEAGVKLVAYGVVGGLGGNEADTRKVFDFAKKMGILVITAEPADGSFELVAKLAKEYDIPVAIHNHPSRPNDPKYKYWSPHYVLDCCKPYKGVIGACADTGHWMRSEVKPIEALKTLEGYIVSMHIKDLNKFGRPDEHDVPFGTGAGDVAAVLAEIDRQKFKGIMSMEYEYNWLKSVPEITQCVEFVRNYGQAKGKK